jgi:hypothetical protein
MAKFHITDPSGAEYEVEGPDDPHAAVAALKKATSMWPKALRGNA